MVTDDDDEHGHGVGLGHVEEVVEAAVELQAVEPEGGGGAEERGDDGERVDEPAEGAGRGVGAEHRRERRADQDGQVLAEAEVGHRAAHHGVHGPAVEAPVEVRVAQRDQRRFLGLWLGQAVRRRGPVRDRLRDAVEEQAGAQPGGEHHRDPGERAELRPRVVRAQPDGAPRVQHQDDAEGQRAEGDQHEGPAEVADHPAQALAHDRAQARRGEEAPADEARDQRCRAPEDGRVDILEVPLHVRPPEGGLTRDRA